MGTRKKSTAIEVTFWSRNRPLLTALNGEGQPLREY